MGSRLISAAVLLALLATAPEVSARREDAVRVMGAVSFGSVGEEGYGVSGSANGGWEFDEVFGVELQGGLGVTDEVDVGPERFYHVELLFPATMTLCSSDSWVCPGSTFELIILSGLGSAWLGEVWSPTVVVGAALDSFLIFSPIDVGLRIGVIGYYDVLHWERLVAMLHINLGMIFRFGGG